MVSEVTVDTITLRFYPIDKIVEVRAPATEITIQQLINGIRDWEDDHLEFGKVADATGKDDLGAGRFTAITLKLVDGWRLKFEDRATLTACMVSGGNLLAVDEAGAPIYPIAEAANVTATIAQSTAAALIAEWTQAEKEEVLTKIDYIPKANCIP